MSPIKQCPVIMVKITGHREFFEFSPASLGRRRVQSEKVRTIKRERERENGRKSTIVKEGQCVSIRDQKEKQKECISETVSQAGRERL